MLYGRKYGIDLVSISVYRYMGIIVDSLDVYDSHDKY